jgi:hypothetical protein
MGKINFEKGDQVIYQNGNRYYQGMVTDIRNGEIYFQIMVWNGKRVRLQNEVVSTGAPLVNKKLIHALGIQGLRHNMLKNNFYS